MSREELMRLISHLGRSASPDAVESLAQGLESGNVEPASISSALPTSSVRALLEDVSGVWSSTPEVSGSELALALRVSSMVACEIEAEQELEIVWTGPSTEVVPVRRTEQVLRGLIEGARERLLVVSYAVYGVTAVCEAVNKAAARGVRTDIVLEFEGHGEQDWDPLDALGSIDSRVRVLEWPYEQRLADGQGGRPGMIHAKCAVADGERAFVSSANLTKYALERNMELGLLVKGGPVPRRIEEHFGMLVDQRVLRPRSR